MNFTASHVTMMIMTTTMMIMVMMMMMMMIRASCWNTEDEKNIKDKKANKKSGEKNKHYLQLTRSDC